MPTKISKIILFLFVLVHFSCEKEYVEPTGLLDGYSFETNPVQFSSSFYFLDDYSLAWTDQEAFDGERSLQITSNKRDNESFAFWSIPYSDFQQDQPFKIRVKVKTENVEGDGKIQVNMFARTADRQQVISSGIGEQIGSTNGKWKTLEVSLDRAPSSAVGVVDIYFLFTPGSTGTVYWDKLEIYTGE